MAGRGRRREDEPDLKALSFKFERLPKYLVGYPERTDIDSYTPAQCRHSVRQASSAPCNSSRVSSCADCMRP
jgi:hypothetical protein